MYTQTALFLLVVTMHSSAAQNDTSACSAPDVSAADFGRYQKIAQAAVFSYLAGEDDVADFGEPSKRVLTDNNIALIKSFMAHLDPQQMKESAYAQILETGEVPSGRLENVGFDYVIKQRASQIIRELKGPTKIALDVLRDKPELKYNRQLFAKTVRELLQSQESAAYTDDITENDVSADDVDDPYIQCRADLNYLYDPILQTIGCLIRDIISGLTLFLCEGFTIEVPNPISPNLPPIEIDIPPIQQLCINVTSPSRPSPNVTGTYIDAQFKIPPGITQGNLYWAGSFDQCKRIADVTYDTALVGLPSTMHTFKARYCRTKTSLPLDLAVNLSLNLGVCMPDSCATPEAIANITSSYEVLGLRISEMFCGFDDLEVSDDPSSVVAVVIILILLIIVVAATIYDMAFRRQVLVSRLRAVAPSLINGSTVGSTPGSTNGSIAGSRKPSWQMGNGSGAASPIPASPIEDKTSGPNLPVSFNVGTEDGTLTPKPISRQTSYTELHTDDFRKYSLTPVNSDVNLLANLSRPPSYVSQASLMSTSDLISNEIGALKEKQRSLHEASNVLDDRPSCLERLEGAFVAFSAYSHVCRTFNLDVPKNRLLACDGMKVMSIVWAVYGYTWLLGTLYSESWTTTNLLPAILDNIRTFLFQVVVNFPFSSDTAFVVSGCLLTYNWMRRFDKEQKFKWQMVVRHYLHRYASLMIPMMFTLMFYTCLYRLLVAGPLIPPQIADADRCRDQWHLNFFMLHNIIRGDEGMCLTWTFNVAIFFQFHLIAPFILIPLVLKPKLGYLMFGLTYLTHFITLGIYSADLADSGNAGVWFNDILLMPWCRAGPILVGMAAGYALYMHKRKPFNVPVIVRVVAWILTIPVLMAPIFSTYDALRENGNSWNRAEIINYQLWSRSAFGLGVAWIIFSAEIGIGGFPGRFVRYRQWMPLSRLSYVLLLVSPIFIFRNVYSQEMPITITFHVMLYFFLANMTWSLILGFVLALLFQFPFAELENALFCKRKRDIIKLGRNPLDDLPDQFESNPSVAIPPSLKSSFSSTPRIDITNVELRNYPNGEFHRSESINL